MSAPGRPSSTTKEANVYPRRPRRPPPRPSAGRSATRRVEPAEHVAAPVAVEELDVRVELDHRPVVRAVDLAVAVGRDRGADELRRDVAGESAVEVDLDVVDERRVPVAGHDDRVAAPGRALNVSVMAAARPGSRPRRRARRGRRSGRRGRARAIITLWAMTFHRASDALQAVEQPLLLRGRRASCAWPGRAGRRSAAASPSPHGWSVRYWRVSSTLNSARSPEGRSGR